jgi:predicted nucleotidyltransferase component of viral defense system
MKGLVANTKVVINEISDIPILKNYTLIGGTAISLQLGHRLSEDLDFSKWKEKKNDKPSVERSIITNELSRKGNLQNEQVLGFDQVDYLYKNVKLQFIAEENFYSPVSSTVHIKGNIYAADLKSLGVMKVKAALDRGQYRDYYDIYCLLKNGISLEDMIKGATKYTNHYLKTKSIVSILTNPKHFQKSKRFHLLAPKYDINSDTIADEIVKHVQKHDVLNRKQNNLDNKNNLSL